MDSYADNETNGRNNGIVPLEMEDLTGHRSSNARQSYNNNNNSGTVNALLQLIKLYMEYYPKATASVAAFICVICMYFFVVQFENKPLKRHEMHHHFSDIDMQYNFKASQVDHWCLFGGDDTCQCDDFTDPVSREERSGWMDAHQSNINRVDKDIFYDVVFFGDDLVEEMNGTWLDKVIPEGPRIKRYYDENFNKNHNGDLDGLAMGIAGDVTPNLLWRIQHGEMPRQLMTKVWWISIGINDLVRGGCSEEVVVLGILRIAEELYARDRDAVVVIQGILPRSIRQDGSLDAKSSGHHPFAVPHGATYKANEARKNFSLWPSIQAVNKEIEDFCSKHSHMIYFDASSLFLGSMSNSHFQSSSQQIVTELMPDYKHLSYMGHKVLGDRIQQELKRIIMNDDENNDIEKKTNR